MKDRCQSKKIKQEMAGLVDFLKVISEENRLRILCLLQKGELCVCEIQEKLELSQNLTSHHLKVLKDFELIQARKEGTNVFYSLNKKQTKQYVSLLSKFI